MTDFEQGELRVVVPVGFLLDEEQEVTVSVDRPDGSPLPIRLRLVPAACAAVAAPDQIVDDHTPMPIGWPRRRLARSRAIEDDNDGYPGYDVGGGD